MKRALSNTEISTLKSTKSSGEAQIALVWLKIFIVLFSGFAVNLLTSK